MGALRKSRQSLFKLTWGRVILCGKPFLSRQNFQNFFTHHCVLGAQYSDTIQHIRVNLEIQFQVLILLLTSMRTTASSSLKWGGKDALLTLLHYPNVWWVSEKKRDSWGNGDDKWGQGIRFTPAKGGGDSREWLCHRKGRGVSAGASWLPRPAGSEKRHQGLGLPAPSSFTHIRASSQLGLV